MLCRESKVHQRLKENSDILLKPRVLNCDILWHLAVVIMLGAYELNTDGSWAYGQGTVSDTYQNHERND